MITYEQLDGSKMMRIQRYDQCGEYLDGFDVQAGTFISREAYISIDSNDDVIALHSYSNIHSDISVCHVVKVASNRGFVRKYDRSGAELWTKADFLDQITEVVYD